MLDVVLLLLLLLLLVLLELVLLHLLLLLLVELLLLLRLLLLRLVLWRSSVRRVDVRRRLAWRRTSVPLLVSPVLPARPLVPSSSDVEMAESRWRKRDRGKRAAREGGAAGEVGHLVVRCASDFGIRGDELLGLGGGDEGSRGVLGGVRGGLLFCVGRRVSSFARSQGKERTGFEVDEVLDEVLHELILRDHVPLEAHHLADDGLVVLAKVLHVLPHTLLMPVQPVDLRLEGSKLGLTGRIGVGGGGRACASRTSGGNGSRFARCGSFPLRGVRVSLGSGKGAGREREERTLMCSSEDFMSARKLGCLNSQVCVC